MRLCGGSVGALVVVGILGVSRSALAADATEPIRIEYHAEVGCPSAYAFNAQVFRRTTSARLATGGDTARTFIVSIERRGNALVGSLVVRQTDGTTESREVAGPDCGEVAKVLALATALAIDPQASLSPTLEESAPPPVEPPKPEPPEPVTPSEPAPPEPSTDDERAPWVVALGPTIEGGVTPRVAYGASAGFGWRSPSGRGALSALGVEFTFLKPPTHKVGTARTSFQLLYARPELCSVALKWYEESGIAPCLGGEVGAVTGWGSDIASAQSRSRLWATVDMGLRLHQALGAAWFVEAEVSVVLPITRYHYVFRDPDTRIFVVPSAAAVGGVRVGARLW